jgi:hypothetical protein
MWIPIRSAVGAERAGAGPGGAPVDVCLLDDLAVGIPPQSQLLLTGLMTTRRLPEAGGSGSRGRAGGACRVRARHAVRRQGRGAPRPGRRAAVAHRVVSGQWLTHRRGSSIGVGAGDIGTDRSSTSLRPSPAAHRAGSDQVTGRLGEWQVQGRHLRVGRLSGSGRLMYLIRVWPPTSVRHRPEPSTGTH